MEQIKEKQYQVWSYCNYEDWNLNEFDTFEEAVEWSKSTGYLFDSIKITKSVNYKIEETT